MSKIGNKFIDIIRIDTLVEENTANFKDINSNQKYRSYLQQLDPRIILITTALFIFVVVSFDKYAISALVPFLIFPVFFILTNDLPIKYLLKKLLLVSPFAILIAIFNPLIDSKVLFHADIFSYAISITGGEVSFISIILRFILTVSMALILIATIGFNGICFALLKLKVPKPFVIQLLFIYRYIFVLIEEAQRMVRAQTLRTFKSKKISYKTFILLLGHLLIRTLDRAERIYMAMCSRGFDGEVRIIRSYRINIQGIAFMTGWSMLFIFCRFVNVPEKIGTLLQWWLR